MTSGDVRRRQAGVSSEFARLPMRTVRAATAADVYAHPRAELARLTNLGLLHRVVPGFYVAVADDRVGIAWMPGLEAAAAGVAVAAYSADETVVVGVSAARLHGAIPRALATAVVEVPTRHDSVGRSTGVGSVRCARHGTSGCGAHRYRVGSGDDDYCGADGVGSGEASGSR